MEGRKGAEIEYEEEGEEGRGWQEERRRQTCSRRAGRNSKGAMHYHAVVEVQEHGHLLLCKGKLNKQK